MATSPVTTAALAFTSKLQRRQTSASVLDSTLPETAKSLTEVVFPFEQKTVIPRGANKGFVTAHIVRILARKTTAEKIMYMLTASERDYVLSVLDEVYAWAESQGFEVAL